MAPELHPLSGRTVSDLVTEIGDRSQRALLAFTDAMGRGDRVAAAQYEGAWRAYDAVRVGLVNLSNVERAKGLPG